MCLMLEAKQLNRVSFRPSNIIFENFKWKVKFDFIEKETKIKSTYTKPY